MKRIVVIDGKSVFYRGYFAMGNLSTKEGIPTGGVFGFAAIAMEIVNKLKPNKVVVAWDKAKTSINKRKAIYDGYKAGRVKPPEDFFAQIPLLKQLIEDLSWYFFECDEYEADDIIGTLGREVTETNENDDRDDDWEMYIISSDLDMLQVVNRNVKMYRLLKGFSEIEEIDIRAVEEKYGIEKEQFLDLKALKGDASDNIPGVPGIGEKTAVKLLNQYGSVTGIYENIEKITGATRKKLEAGEDSAKMSYVLAKIMTDAPISLAEIPEFQYDAAKMREGLKKLEFSSLIRKYGLENGEEEAVNEPKVTISPDEIKAKMHESPEYAKKVLEGRVDFSQVSDPVMRDFDLPLVPVLYKMEKAGIKIDREYFSRLKDEFSQKVAGIEGEICEMAGVRFNVNSPVQLSEIFFSKLNLPTTGIKKTTKGYSTGAKELAKLEGKHPIIQKIIEYREASKLLSTYIVPLPQMADENDRVHTTFTQEVTETGRLSSVNPNLQNIPTRTEAGKRIKEGFVAEKGKVFVSADYSQFELRLAAVLAGDMELIRDFQSGVDIHTKTASEAFNIPFDQVTKNQRRAAKVINFGVLYGMSAKGLADAAGMSVPEAQEFIKKYFELRKPIKEYLEKTLRQAREKGYVETFFGRKKMTPDVKASNFFVRAAAERAAQNMPIQGTEADLVKRAMITLDQELPEGARLIMQVHDSLMVECDEEQTEEVAGILRWVMENVAPELPIRLDVDVEVGEKWG